MFTGLIETVGRIEKIRSSQNYKIMRVNSNIQTGELSLGESISCDGACLTVTDISRESFEAEISQETLAKTIAGGYKSGRLINLERALKVGDRLGGHQVSGHIDDIGSVKSIKSVGKSLELTVTFDKKYDPLVIDKGSIAVNGVSLTVNSSDSGLLSVNLIPHSAEKTTLAYLKSGEQINLEFDLIGKYIIKLAQTKSGTGLTKEKLLESGW